MERLHRVAYRIVWVNPLKASPGYAPLAPGWRRPCRTSTSSSRGTRSLDSRSWSRSLAARSMLAVTAAEGRSMKEVLDDIDRWRAAGKRVAVARVVGLDGSGPRDPGAAMAVSEDGEVVGSVSGGCVEGAVLTEALEVLASGHPQASSPSATPTTTRSPSASPAAARSTSSSSRSTGEHRSTSASPRRSGAPAEPVALATVIDGARARAPSCWSAPTAPDRVAGRRRARPGRRPRRPRRARSRPDGYPPLRRPRRGPRKRASRSSSSRSPRRRGW